MRPVLLAAVLAACSASAEPTPPAAAQAPVPALEVTFVDTLDGADATYLAVGGKLRVRVPDAPTALLAAGPFAIVNAGDSLVITATGEGTGEIEIETPFGATRFAVSAAPIASVSILPSAPGRAQVVLRDASGNRLVDASLRVAPGSAPITFDRDGWDRIALDLTAPGAVLVKTDLLAATRGVIEPAAKADCPALAMVNSLRARVSANPPRMVAGARNANPRRSSGRM
jgi:hypothetical protein